MSYIANMAVSSVGEKNVTSFFLLAVFVFPHEKVINGQVIARGVAIGRQSQKRNRAIVAMFFGASSCKSEDNLLLLRSLSHH